MIALSPSLSIAFCQHLVDWIFKVCYLPWRMGSDFQTVQEPAKEHNVVVLAHKSLKGVIIRGLTLTQRMVKVGGKEGVFLCRAWHRRMACGLIGRQSLQGAEEASSPAAYRRECDATQVSFRGACAEAFFVESFTSESLPTDICVFS
jgi:hypothetical protein